MQQEGLAGLRNGDSLRRAGACGVGIFLTGDRNLQFQQNAAGIAVGIVVLAARSNKLSDLLPLIPALLSQIDDVRPGEVRRITSG